MRNSRYVPLTTFLGFVLALQATCAFASKEGAALVEPILWIVAIVLVTFATLVIGGGVLGAFRASRSGESILKGGARGLVKGSVAFLVVGAVSITGITILGILWIAYSLLQSGADHPIAFFIAVLSGAAGVGLLCGLIPLVAGAVTKQKKLGISGFFAGVVGGLFAGAWVAIPMALGFTLKIVLNWKKVPEQAVASPPPGTHGT